MKERKAVLCIAFAGSYFLISNIDLVSDFEKQEAN
jgi:hypothetical protein